MDLTDEELKATKNKDNETITLIQDEKKIEILRTDIIKLYEQILTESEYKEKTADEMFEELGYKFTDIDFGIELHIHEYEKDTKLEEGVRHQVIWFDLNTKQLYIHNSITIQELKAIYKKCQELRDG